MVEYVKISTLRIVKKKLARKRKVTVEGSDCFKEVQQSGRACFMYFSLPEEYEDVINLVKVTVLPSGKNIFKYEPSDLFQSPALLCN